MPDTDPGEGSGSVSAGRSDPPPSLAADVPVPTREARRDRTRALVVLVLLTLIWGYSWVVVKIALSHAPPFAFGVLRVFLAALALFAALALAGRDMRPRAIGACALIGLLQSGLFIGFTSWATVAGGVAKTSVLVFTMPFWTTLFAWAFLGERLRGLQWISNALALAGLVAIVDPWHLRGTIGSSLLAISSGMIWALSAVLTKKLRVASRTDLLSFTAWQMVFGGIPLAIVAWLVPERPIDWTPGFLVAVSFNGICATGLGWLMWLYVLKRLSVGAASISMLAIPAVAILSAAVQLGERPHAREWLGIALICAALALVSMPGRNRPPGADPLPAPD